MFHHRDWRLELQRQCHRLRSGSPAGETGAAAAIDLGQALELAEPNRVHAVEMYLLAWRAARQHPRALERAYELCLELAQLPTAAKIARILYLETRQPQHARREGLAWLDAGEPDRAVRALMAATRDDPGDEIAALALATARHEQPDLRAEVVALRDRAAATRGELAAELLLGAARLARILGADDHYGALVCAAVKAWPVHEGAFGLCESWLAARNASIDLASMYRARVAVDPGAALEVMRRAGTRWVLSKTQIGLGVQLLTRCLERGYDGDQPIPGHLATLALLRRFAELAGAEPELLNLIGRGLARAHSRAEIAALAGVGLDIAWGRLRDPRLAHPVAAILGELARHHPALVSYCDEGGMAMGQAMSHKRKRGVVYLDELTRPPTSPEPESLLDLAAIEEAPDRPPVSIDTAAADDLAIELEVEELEEEGAIPEAPIADHLYIPVPPIVARPPEDERRAEPRLTIPADVAAAINGKTVKTVTRDLGERGLFIFTDEVVDVPCRISMTVVLPDTGGWQIDEFALAGKIVRAEPGGYAVELADPPSAYCRRVRGLLES